MRSTRVPYSYSTRLSRVQSRVSGAPNYSTPITTTLSTFLFAAREIIRNNRRILIRWGRNSSFWKNVDTCMVASVWKHHMEPTSLLAFRHISTSCTTWANTDHVYRTMANVVITITAKIFSREFPVTRNYPLLHSAYHFTSSFTAIPRIQS